MVNVFGSAPAGLTPFKDTGLDGDDFRMLDHVGKAGIFKVQGPQEVTTKYGLKTAIKTDVVIIDWVGGAPAKEFSDVLIFSQVPVTQLKALAGQTTVAVIAAFETRTGGTAPKLAEPSQAAVTAAEKHLAGNDKPPF